MTKILTEEDLHSIDAMLRCEADAFGQAITALIASHEALQERVKELEADLVTREKEYRDLDLFVQDLKMGYRPVSRPG